MLLGGFPRELRSYDLQCNDRLAGDVASERAIVRDVVYEWNAVHSSSRKLVLLPIGWETRSSPEMGAPAQSIINKQVLTKCDLLVGVFWTRIGTPTEHHLSGTVEEIEEHIVTGKPAMLYFSSQPVALDTVDIDQIQRLLRKMSTDFPTASVGSSQATPATVDKSFTASNTEIQATPRSARPQTAKRKSTSVKSKTDWARLKANSASAAPSEQHPEAEVAHIVRGAVRRGLAPPPSKASISLRVDQDVLEWFKTQGPGYQTRINTVLRAFRDASV